MIGKCFGNILGWYAKGFSLCKESDNSIGVNPWFIVSLVHVGSLEAWYINKVIYFLLFHLRYWSKLRAMTKGEIFYLQALTSMCKPKYLPKIHIYKFYLYVIRNQSYKLMWVVLEKGCIWLLINNKLYKLCNNYYSSHLLTNQLRAPPDER